MPVTKFRVFDLWKKHYSQDDRNNSWILEIFGTGIETKYTSWYGKFSIKNDRGKRQLTIRGIKKNETEILYLYKICYVINQNHSKDVEKSLYDIWETQVLEKLKRLLKIIIWI